jgi:hypothetical protein
MRTGRSGTPTTGAHQLDQARLAHVAGGVHRGLGIALRIAQRIDAEETHVAGAIHAEEPREHRVVHVDDAPGLLAQPRRQVGAEVDSQRLREGAAALVTDAEQLAHLRMAAVGGDQVAARELAFVAAADSRTRSVTLSASWRTARISVPCSTVAPAARARSRRMGSRRGWFRNQRGRD